MKKLKKYLAALSLVLLLASAAFADQAMWIAKKEAEAAVKLLKTKKEIKHFCAPAGDTKARREKILKVSMVRQDGDWWSTCVNDEELDLAYVYVQDKDGKWVNLAMVLGVEVHDVPAEIGF